MPRPGVRAAALLAVACAPLLLPAARAAESPPPGADALRGRFPWDVPKSDIEKLPWEGLHGDLAALLKVQARGREVALIVFNDGFSALALNCLVSLISYGNSSNYVVAAAGAASLAYCRALRLPCFDGSRLLQNTTAWGAAPAGAGGGGGSSGGGKEALGTDADAARGSADWFHLVWIKTLAAHAVNVLGYDILFAGAAAGGGGVASPGGARPRCVWRHAPRARASHGKSHRAAACRLASVKVECIAALALSCARARTHTHTHTHEHTRARAHTHNTHTQYTCTHTHTHTIHNTPHPFHIQTRTWCS